MGIADLNELERALPSANHAAPPVAPIIAIPPELSPARLWIDPSFGVGAPAPVIASLHIAPEVPGYRTGGVLVFGATGVVWSAVAALRAVWVGRDARGMRAPALSRRVGVGWRRLPLNAFQLAVGLVEAMVAQGKSLIRIEIESVEMVALSERLQERYGDVVHRISFYAPYAGHPSAPDFVEFYRDPFVLFGDELPDLYE